MTQFGHYNTEKEQAKLQFEPLGNSKLPTVLQILPALVTGGGERGSVDIAGAIVNAGGRAIVVSAGGPMTHELKRLGGEHIELPVDSKNQKINPKIGSPKTSDKKRPLMKSRANVTQFVLLKPNRSSMTKVE